jgi:hypothetical protein
MNGASWRVESCMLIGTAQSLNLFAGLDLCQVGWEACRDTGFGERHCALFHVMLKCIP